MDSISIRKATILDVPALVQLRRLMFESMGHDDIELLEAGDLAAEYYFKQSIPTGEFHAWVAENSKGVIVSNIGLIVDQHPPSPRNLSGKIAYLMNLFTISSYRRQGIARKLLEEAITEIEKMGIQKVTLHATEMGKELYTQLGFTETNEMRLKL
jgi:ribosomal protein S18 acetylase RimI-like enzyme